MRKVVTVLLALLLTASYAQAQTQMQAQMQIADMAARKSTANTYRTDTINYRAEVETAYLYYTNWFNAVCEDMPLQDYNLIADYLIAAAEAMDICDSRMSLSTLWWDGGVYRETIAAGQYVLEQWGACINTCNDADGWFNSSCTWAQMAFPKCAQAMLALQDASDILQGYGPPPS